MERFGDLANEKKIMSKSLTLLWGVSFISALVLLDLMKTYEDTSSLRYGHLMIMTDQDHDGSHIKGLLINFLHHFWPSLLSIPVGTLKRDLTLYFIRALVYSRLVICFSYYHH